MTDTLTKAEIVENLIQKTGVKKVDAKKMVDFFFEFISESLSRGEDVKLSSFGNFEIQDKKARPGRNPRTKEDAQISARRIVVFKPGAKLKKRLLDSSVQ